MVLPVKNVQKEYEIVVLCNDFPTLYTFDRIVLAKSADSGVQ